MQVQSYGMHFTKIYGWTYSQPSCVLRTCPALPCTCRGLALAGWLWAWRAYTRCSRNGEIPSLVGWPGENRKTARGSACVWAGMYHVSPWLAMPALCSGTVALPGATAKLKCRGGWAAEGNRAGKQECLQSKAAQQHSTPIPNSAPSRAQGAASERLAVTSVLGPPRFYILDFYHKEYGIKYSAGMLKFCVFVICCHDD